MAKRPANKPAAEPMPHGGSSAHPETTPSEKRTSSYRGVPIEIAGNVLKVGGREVLVEVTEDRVYSHEMAYRHFGSMEELAEALIRDWGSAKIDRTPAPHHGPGHEH